MFCLVKWTESAGDCQTTVSVELLLCLVESSRIELSSRGWFGQRFAARAEND